MVVPLEPAFDTFPAVVVLDEVDDEEEVNMTKLLLFGWLSWSVLFVVAGETWPVSSVSVLSLIRMSEGSMMSVVVVASVFCGPD